MRAGLFDYVGGDDGIPPSLERMRNWRHGDGVFLYAFDLIARRAQAHAGQLGRERCA
jgi:hypothetical protein